MSPQPHQIGATTARPHVRKATTRIALIARPLVQSQAATIRVPLATLPVHRATTSMRTVVSAVEIQMTNASLALKTALAQRVSTTTTASQSAMEPGQVPLTRVCPAPRQVHAHLVPTLTQPRVMDLATQMTPALLARVPEPAQLELTTTARSVTAQVPQTQRALLAPTALVAPKATILTAVMGLGLLTLVLHVPRPVVVPLERTTVPRTAMAAACLTQVARPVQSAGRATLGTSLTPAAVMGQGYPTMLANRASLEDAARWTTTQDATALALRQPCAWLALRTELAQ